MIGITSKTYKVKLLSEVTDFQSTHIKLYYKESIVGDSNGDQPNKE